MSIECRVSEISGRLGSGPADDAVADEELLPNARGARWLRRHLAGGVAVLTTTVEDGFRGATITACTFLSAEPLLLLAALEIDSQMLDWIQESGCFAVSLLSWRDQFLADQFAGFTPRASRTFGGIDFHVAEGACPVLDRSIGWAACQLHDEITTGDHRCLIGRVIALGSGSGDPTDPLVYYRNRYRRLS
jgi:flavin reductase (DIM6/NTAB) family NADH-FMN oxidoreductase RutF